ncbi:TlpA family protein disulfide reductase [Gramella sp. BOM4]|nr:TlpA family protein disulfide reductase [Christiangramia bathymodioli]
MNRYIPLNRILFGFIIIFLSYGCKDDKKAVAEKSTDAQKEEVSHKAVDWPEPQSKIEGIAMYEKFEDLEPIFRFDNDTTYVINFWATWCKPCIKELPYFEKIDSIYQDNKVKVVLVSLDFPDQIEKQLVPFVKKNELNSKVVVLLDGKYNDWIDKVSPDWTGAIPATYIYRNEKNKLIGTAFEDVSEIENELKIFL